MDKKGKEIVKKNTPFLDTSVLDSDSSENDDTRDIDERIFEEFGLPAGLSKPHIPLASPRKNSDITISDKGRESFDPFIDKEKEKEKMNAKDIRPNSVNNIHRKMSIIKEKEGLVKKSLNTAIGKKWGSRYIALKFGYFSIYKSEKDKNKNKYESRHEQTTFVEAEVLKDQDVGGRHYCMKVRFGDTIYHLQCAEESELFDWLSSLSSLNKPLRLAKRSVSFENPTVQIEEPHHSPRKKTKFADDVDKPIETKPTGPSPRTPARKILLKAAELEPLHPIEEAKDKEKLSPTQSPRHHHSKPQSPRGTKEELPPNKPVEEIPLRLDLQDLSSNERLKLEEEIKQKVEAHIRERMEIEIQQLIALEVKKIMETPRSIEAFYSQTSERKVDDIKRDKKKKKKRRKINIKEFLCHKWNHLGN